ncbi:MAG: hypothetical protein RSB71_00580 [Bacilli bacterium]
MKKIIIVFILLVILSLTFYFRKPIMKLVVDKVIFRNGIVNNKANAYKLNYDFKYVKQTKDFYASNKQHLKDIIFTLLNDGNESFYFFCDYEECHNDLNELSNSNEIVNINNFLNPYNGYRKINMSINSLDKVTFNIIKTYDQESITAIENKIDRIMSEIITDDMSTLNKIKAFHNYIINTTKYDKQYIESGLNDLNSSSHKATGPLFFNKALCGGYSDTMSIFLNKLNIPNYRIASKNHIWNLVYLDNNWYHLDTTWDDPVTSDGSDIVLDTFFLISSKQLEKVNTNYHAYDKNIYIEAN